MGRPQDGQIGSLGDVQGTLKRDVLGISWGTIFAGWVVAFPAAESDPIIGFDKLTFVFGNFEDVKDLSFNMLFIISDELQEEASFVTTLR